MLALSASSESVTSWDSGVGVGDVGLGDESVTSGLGMESVTSGLASVTAW